MENQLLNLFFEATINDTTIYIKISSDIHEDLFNVLHDKGYVVKKCSPKRWDYFVYYGSSYEIDTIEEVEEFKQLNNKAKNLRQ